MPVEAQATQLVALLEQFQIADVMRGTGIGHGRAGPLGLDPEYPVFQASTVAVPDQRDFPLWIFGELVVVVPRRHPEGCVGGIALQPIVPLVVVQVARLFVEEVTHLLKRNAH
ncbi:hypothetical protein D3C73_1262670 [compost metagenome]